MFIESGGGSSGRDDEHGAAGEPWLVSALGWFLPWPALVAWLVLAGLLLDGWLAVASSFAAIGVACWRGLRALPDDGLSESRQ